MRGESGERALQVIILHTLVILGSVRVPPLCSTINKLEGGNESEEEEEEERGRDREIKLVGPYIQR